ncbi:MAG: universal stress protein [Cocleimonas sp.]|nr:universal stress protein [Cocleimonas sp.]
MPQAQVQPIEESSLDHLPEYKEILLAADSSDYSNQGIKDAIELAKLWDGNITGTHVYAAKMHDMRFKQMEGGLPEQFRQEEELERQRDVHDDLIGRGLSIITDSYLDQVDRACDKEKITFLRRSLEGKNYRELTNEVNSGQYDLLIMGAQGLGAIKGSLLGTVCERVSRRSQIDTLIIKSPNIAISKGPIVVAIDGSQFSYGGLLRGITLAQHWSVPLHVISAFDPYYHYVAFNRIAGVLSEEAGKVFRFQEQEQLHEEIIDSGLAKIYDGHLCVAEGIAEDYDIKITKKLLDGKPWDAILKYLKQVDPSLLIIGKTGIHADDELDIGGNSENLLRLADCAVLLTQYAHQPQVERVADVTTSWTVEAEQRMKNVPSFVQNMARGAILRYAQQHGHTVITESIVEEATKQLMPSRSEQAMEDIVNAYDAGELKKRVTPKPMQWSDMAQARLDKISDESLRHNLAMRAEKKARGDDSYRVELAHINAFLDTEPASLHWRAAALARLTKVPEGFMRNTSKQRIEAYAQSHGYHEITLDVAEEGLAESRQAMETMMTEQGQPVASKSDPIAKKESICPFARMAELKKEQSQGADNKDWTASAEARLQLIPEGYCRDMTRKAVESIADKSDEKAIDTDFVQQVLNTFSQGSAKIEETLSWDDNARQRIANAPDMVRGMLTQEIETWIKEQGGDQVTEAAVDAVGKRWKEGGAFHLGANDARNANL